ncbi:MAG: patatin-like phospholipase family protein [Candidatus Omnitrophota bacterium]
MTNPIFSIFQHFKLIRKIPVFSKLNWLDIQRIGSHVQILNFQKGEVIYRQGDPSNGFYYILSGRAQGYCLDEKGGKYDVEFFRRDMYFGIVSLLTNETHSMTFEAVNDSRILYIPKAAFLNIVKTVPELGMEFSTVLSRRLQARSRRNKTNMLSKIISVYSQVKQSGSSTYAFHLAGQIAKQTGRDVILTRIASALSQPESSAGTEATPSWKNPGRPLVEIAGNHDLIRSLVVSNEDGGADFLNVSFHPDDDRLVLEISDFVTSLASEYDYVIVDLPNDMDNVVLKTLTQSDEVHLLVHDDTGELQMTNKVIDALVEKLKEKFNAHFVRVILKTRQNVSPLPFNVIREIFDFDIYARLPFITEQQLSEARDFGAVRVRFPDEDSPFGKEMIKIARDVGDVRLGLVLGGGAALGIAHIGVLKVFEREKIFVDVIAGSSMGALVASLWATEYDAECLANIAQQFRDQRSMLKLLDPVIPISGVIGGRLIKRWLYRFLGDKYFYDTRLPLKIVAYDLNNHQELVYDSGRLIDAVRKSISIPGVFEPVVENERVIIDGGVLNPVPVNILRRQGVNKVIAVNVLQSPEEVMKGYETKRAILTDKKAVSFFKAPFDFIRRRFQRDYRRPRPTISEIMVQTLLASEYEIARQAVLEADVLVHPDLTGIQWHELHRVDELIKRGEEAAERALPAIRELLKKKDKIHLTVGA